MEARSSTNLRKALAACVVSSLLATVPAIASAEPEPWSGIVVNASGEPIAGAEVFRVTRGGADEPNLVPVGSKVVTGTNGRFELPAVSSTVGTGAVTETHAGLLLDEDARGTPVITLAPIPVRNAGIAGTPTVANAIGVTPALPDAPANEEHVPLARPEVSLLTRQAPEGASLMEPYVMAAPAAMAGGPSIRLRDSLFESFARAESVGQAGAKTVDERSPSQPAPANAGGPADSAVFTLRVGDNYYPWVVYAPFPADLDQDGTVDGTIQVYPGSGESVCFALDYWLDVAPERGFAVGIISGGTELNMGGREIPWGYTLCATPGTTASASFQASNPRGDFWFHLNAAGVSFYKELDEMPANLTLAISWIAGPLGLDQYSLEYAADRVNDLHLEVNGPVTAILEVNDLPKQLSADFYRTSRLMSGEVRYETIGLEYEAPEVIPRFATQFGTSSSPQLAHIELVGLPATFSGSASWRRDSDGVYYAEYSHSAASDVRSLTIRTGAHENTLTLGLAYLPRTIDHARFHLEERGGHTKYTIDVGAVSPIMNAFVELGVTGGFNHSIVNIPVLPASVGAEFQMVTDGKSLEAMQYTHTASRNVPALEFVGNFGGGEYAINVRAFDIPASASALLSVKPEPGASIAPTFTYTASDSGLSLHAEVSGWGMGAGSLVEAHIVGVPARVTTTHEEKTEGHLLSVDTHGSGSLRRLDVKANLPEALRDLPFSDFRVYASNLEHLVLVLSNVRDDTLYCGTALAVECHWLRTRDVGYFAMYHGTLLFHLPGSSIALDLDFIGQQFEGWYWSWSCYCFLQDWTTKYNVTSPNWSVYDASAFDSGKIVRLLGRTNE